MSKILYFMAMSLVCLNTASGLFSSKPASPVDTAMKANFGSSMMPGKCQADYGKIKWAGVENMMSDPAQKTAAITHLNTKVTPCLTVDNPNFLKQVKSSCDAGPTVKFKEKNDICTKADQLIKDSAQRVKDDALFPGVTDIGCTKGVAGKFDPTAFTELSSRNQDPKMSQKIDGFIGRLAKCATSAGDPNFNTTLLAKFSDSPDCKTPQGLAQYTKNPNANAFIAKIYGPQGLCTTARGTAKTIETNAKVAQAKKSLGVPSTPLGYTGFPVGLVSPLGSAQAPEFLDTWFKGDPTGFGAHFSKIEAGLKGADGKVVNPKATEAIFSACGSVLAQVKIPQIQSICTLAKTTHTNNQDLTKKQETLKAALKGLGVPSTPLGYAGFPVTLVSPLGGAQAPEFIKSWSEIDPKTFDTHFSKIEAGLKGADGKVVNPKAAEALANACTTTLAQIDNPKIKGICLLANDTNTKNKELLEKQAKLKEVLKGLGVPTTPMGYMGFPATLVTPLAQPQAPDLIKTWSELDSKAFDAHFSKIEAGMKGTDGKVVNPKAAEALANACTTTLAQVENLTIKSICTLANDTNTKNKELLEKQTKLKEALKGLGVPSTPLGYVGLPATLVAPLAQPQAADYLTTWFDIDPKAFEVHFSKIEAGLKGADGKVVNPKVAESLAGSCGEGGTLASVQIPKIQEICTLANDTNTKNKELLDKQTKLKEALKSLGVPSTPLGYVGFPVTLVAPLTQPQAPEHITTWSEIDPKGFDTHFSKILSGAQGADGKIVNPKAVEALAGACGEGGTLASVQIPKIQEICTTAIATNTTNQDLIAKQNELKEVTGALGVPTGPQAFVMYKACSEGMAAKLNSEGLNKLTEMNAALAQNHVNGVTACLDIKHPKFTQALAANCEGGLNQDPLLVDTCTKAKEVSDALAAQQGAAGDPNADPNAEGALIDSSTGTVPGEEVDAASQADLAQASVAEGVDLNAGLNAIDSSSTETASDSGVDASSQSDLDQALLEPTN